MKERGWDVKLPCVKCGKPVLRGRGFYCQPVKDTPRGGQLRPPWGKHCGPCPSK